jgi:phage host-nuclease inhibitor protein Gam
MPRSLNVRLDLLESAVSEMSDLPTQVNALSSQIVQLGRELRDEISAVRADMAVIATELRTEIAVLGKELRAEIASMQDELRAEMLSMRSELRAEMASMRNEFAAALMATEDRLVVHMRTLHEDVLERITLLGEARQVRRGTRKTPRRKKR